MRRFTFIALLLAVGLLLADWGEVPPDRSEATVGPGTMQFRVASGSSCMPMSNPTKCSVPGGGQFQLAVAVTDFPAGGYTAMGTDIDWTGTALTYKPAMSAASEIVWPGATIPKRALVSSTRVQHAALSPSLGAMPSMHKGNVVRITMNCTSTTSTNTINLVPSDPNTNPLGASLVDGGGTVVPTQDSIQINCVPNLDSDGDGCTDLRENGMNPLQGGQRNHLDFWDFFDTPNASNVRDKVINTPGDILGVAQRFAANDAMGTAAINRNSDPLAGPPPPAPAYHPAFDRGVQIGPNAWDRAPPDGAITVPSDLLGVARQFAHSCL